MALLDGVLTGKFLSDGETYIVWTVGVSIVKYIKEDEEKERLDWDVVCVEGNYRGRKRTVKRFDNSYSKKSLMKDTEKLDMEITDWEDGDVLEKLKRKKIKIKIWKKKNGFSEYRVLGYEKLSDEEVKEFKEEFADDEGLGDLSMDDEDGLGNLDLGDEDDDVDGGDKDGLDDLNGVESEDDEDDDDLDLGE